MIGLLCGLIFADDVLSFRLRDDVDVEMWKQQHPSYRRVRPLFSLERAQRLEKRAMHHSSRMVPRLTHLLRFEGSSAAVSQMKEQLRLDPVVRNIRLRPKRLPPPPGDIDPPTPNFEFEQGYLFEDPGINAHSLWEEGIIGEGVRIADVEYAWGLEHEDLMDLPVYQEEGQTPHPDLYVYNYDRHGSAVLGITSAVNNGYGCTGIAHGSDVYLFPEYTVEEDARRPQAIMAAIEMLSAGDVLLLEMQDYGDPSCGESLDCLVPAEVDHEIWTLTRLAVDSGIVVVAAAGNGTQNLDDSWYQENWLSWGDSGAILVGAGMPNLEHAWGALNYGSRIDLQSWGYQVFTLSYDYLEILNNDPKQMYTTDFSGSSPAAAIVAGGVALLQSGAIDTTGLPLHPQGLRRLLVDTAVASGSSYPIGSHVDLLASYTLLLSLDQDQDGFYDAYYGGLDCDDVDPSVQPDAEDPLYDGIDQNCDGLSDYDADGDGYDAQEYGGDDCDDADATISPGAAENHYDDLDQNCDGLSDYDADGDGYDAQEYGGDDCDDTKTEVYPGATEQYYDGIDQNCDDLSDYDADGDGYDAADFAGTDCNDLDEAIYPGANEVFYDGVDQNCDGLSDYDADGDGFERLNFGGQDCADDDPTIHPQAEDVPRDGIDQDCSGSDVHFGGCRYLPSKPNIILMWVYLFAFCRRK